MAESTVRILFLGDSAQAVRSVSRLESSFGSLGRATKLLTGALAVGLVGGLAASVKGAIEFQHQMELVKTQAGASQKEVDKMSKALLGLAKSVGTGPEDLAKGLFHIESAGIRGADALHILTAAAKGAKIGGADLEVTTNALIGAFKSGVKGAGSMEHAMAVLNATVGAGNMRMTDLTSAMGTGLLSSAKAVGISMQDVGAAVAELTVQNENASEASTRLQMAFLTMAAGSDKGNKSLKSIGITQFQLATDMRTKGLIFALQDLENHLKASGKDANEQTAIIADVFGRRSLKAILPLLQHMDDLRQRQESINQTTGKYGDAWAATQQTVSFKLAQAKASLQAAAIPIGDVLLPAVVKVADAVGVFAGKVEQHMPQIKADFQTLGGVVNVLGQALGRLATFAISPVGAGSLIGILAGAGAYKAIGAISGLAIKAGEASIALTGVGTAGLALQGAAMPIAAGLGIVAGALYLISQQGTVAAQEMNAVTDALRGLTNASNDASQAGRQLEQAHINVKTTAIAVRDAERAYRQAVHDSGATSEQARKALLALQQARLNHKQALADEANAMVANTAAQKKQKEQTDATNATLARLNDRLAAASGAASRFGKDALDSGERTSHFVDSMRQVSAQAAAAAKAIPATDKAAQAAAKSIKAAADAAIALATDLGRIPTQKEINVYVRTHQYGSGPHHNAAFGPAIGRAKGGFIPGPSPGAPVPILAHAGEVVLNRAQQQALGGPHRIASMFGFTGQEGPRFATGGFVSKKPGRLPHHPVRPRYRRATGLARRALKGVDNINQAETDADRAYGQLVRQYQIADTDLQFVRTDAQGNSYLSQPDIAQRVGEIDTLIDARNQMLDLLHQEKRKLEHAIEELRKAIAAMVKQIKAERKTIAGLAKKMSAERKKKKPNQNLINKYQSQISAGGTRIGNLTSTIGEFQRSIGEEQLNLRHQLPFDVRDVQLDIMELRQERRDDLGTTLPATTGSGGVVGGGASTVSSGGPDLQALLDQIARLNLALGIQTAQQSIIGSFAKGTLSVPETGLALVHAGESITPAGQVRGGSSPVRPVEVHLHVDDAMSWLKPFIRAEAVSASDQISVRIGRDASARARSGRY